MSGPVCVIYSNTNFTSGCQSFLNSVLKGNAGGLPAFLFYPMMGVIVMLAGFSIVRVYYEYPYGRKMWRSNGFWGFLPMSWGGTLAKMTPLTTKGYWADAGKDFQGFIAAVPGAAVQMTQKLGGVTFMLIDPHIGAAVSPALTSWGNNVLGKKVKASTYMGFLLDWRQGRAKTFIEMDRPTRFRAVDKMDKEEIVSVPTSDALSWVQKKASDMNARDRDWWAKCAIKESEDNQKAVLVENETLLKIEACRTHASSYPWESDGKKFDKPFGDLEKTALYESISEDLANLPDDSKFLPEWFGGRVVDARDAARMVNAMPNSKFGKEYRADIEELWRRKTKGDRQNDLRLLLGGGIFIVCIAFALVVLKSQGFLH